MSSNNGSGPEKDKFLHNLSEVFSHEYVFNTDDLTGLMRANGYQVKRSSAVAFMQRRTTERYLEENGVRLKKDRYKGMLMYFGVAIDNIGQEMERSEEQQGNFEAEIDKTKQRIEDVLQRPQDSA